ncbi:hypothetical protein [Microterricola viridarii]|uniref:Uncharacterized protein n=1 Tax=Microterricola viridarii TaxID=412690 RepID=A0A1H1XFG5_9MICO|nr:hypothetical protein [Microterricola viridarii]SDT07901.1 hypothetical protein SAMN04489834_2778 [Microterricola viridarii]
MESESRVPSPEAAAELLRSHGEMRERVEHLGPSRSYALLTVWGALALAVYMAAFLLSFSLTSGDPAAGGSGAGSGLYSNMLVFPFLLFGALVRGAQERFSIRSRAAGSGWVAKGLALGAFVLLLVLNLFGVDYPWLLNPMLAVAVFITLAYEPLQQLRRAPASSVDERWANQPLSPAVRWMTALIGVTSAVLLATSSESWYAYASLVSMLFLVAVLLGWRAPWGLLRTGFEWGPLHWGAFGVTMSILFLMGVLLSRTLWVTTPVSIAAGAVALLLMLAASVLPTRAKAR